MNQIIEEKKNKYFCRSIERQTSLLYRNVVFVTFTKKKDFNLKNILNSKKKKREREC